MNGNLELPTVPSVKRLLLMYAPSFLLNPVVSVLELSDPAKSIKFYKNKKISIILDECYEGHKTSCMKQSD